ncbi:MAG: lysylphosphatidylglycerol synthase transmembrane domain-containing protein [Candidatus Aminicenantaceae bacterium]
MKKNWWKVVLVLALTLGLLYFFFKSADWGRVWASLDDVNLPFLILAIVLAPTHLVTRSIRWKYLLQHEKEDVSFYSRFAATSIGFAVTLTFPGRLGEVIRPLYLAQREKISKAFTIGTVLVERIFDILTMCLLLGLFMLAKPFYASIFPIEESMNAQLTLWGTIAVSVAAGLLLVILALYFFESLTLRVLGFFLRPLPSRFREKILSLVQEFIQGMSFFKSTRTLLVYFLWSLIVWVSIIFYYWIFLFVYDVHVPFFAMIPFTFLLGVGASIPTPGMVGGFHSFSKLGLTSFFNIEVNLAMAMTIVLHAVTVVVTCLIGYAILWKEGISFFQLKKIGEESNP